MNFRRDLFEELTDNFDGYVYFGDKSKLKPSGLGTIKLNLHGLPYHLLHEVLYLLELRRNLDVIFGIQLRYVSHSYMTISMRGSHN